MKMMKKIVSLCLCVFLLCTFMAVSAGAAAGDAVSALSKDGVAFRFGLVGDSHVNGNGQHKEHFADALDTLSRVGGIDALGLNGDVVLFSSSLSTAPYEIINGYLEQYGFGKDAGEIPYAYAMGNHEFMQNDNNAETCATAVSNFETMMQQPLNYHMEVNGYHVIASGGESYSCQWSAGNYNTDEAWIMSEIEAIEADADYNPQHPIFLMLHHPIIGTVFNGISTVDRRYSTTFVDFLAARPNIVQLTAHKHVAAQYPQILSQDAGFTVFQTPLTSTAGNNSHMHQTSFIDVTTDNKVKIYRIDLTSDTFIGEPWVIDLALGEEGFQYTSEVRSTYTAAPVFADGAAVTASDITNYSATIHYPTGAVDSTGDNMIRRHMVTVTDKETGDVLVSQNYSASYEIVPQPTTLSQTIQNLDAGTTYTVTVTPETMYGVTGETITGEFTTTGQKSAITVEDPITLPYDQTLVGDVTETDDGAGNITTTKSYDKVSSGSVLVRQGDYFTYPITVGEGQAITKPGLYRVTHRYASKRAATVSLSVKYEGDEAYTVADSATTLPSSTDYSIFTEYTEDDYVTLKAGTNYMKIAVTSLSNNDGIYMKLPKLSRVVSGAVVNYPIGTHIYNAVTGENGTGIGSITSNVATTTYQKSSMITFRKGNYIVFPVTVPYTAAYKLELTGKTTGTTTRTVTYKAAISEESLEAAAALTTYNFTTDSQSLTSAWQIYTLTDSYVLEEGKTYYVKLSPTSVSGNHIAQASNLCLTDNGEYGSNANLSALSVSGSDLLANAEENAVNFTYCGTMPASGSITVNATTEIEGATITIGEASAKKTLSASVEVAYGINEVPVSVTTASTNGKTTKHYSIHVVIANTHASLGNTTAYMVKGTADPIDVSKLFNGTGVVKTNGAGDAGFGSDTSTAVYTQIDLGEKYNLYSYTWERTNQGASISGIRILGSNDPTFAEGTYEELGVTDGTWASGAKATDSFTHRVMTTALSGSQAYRYVRIVKSSGSYYPVKMDLYGTPVVNKVEEGLTATVTVPSNEYVVGDTVIVAVYSGKELVDVETITAPSAYSVSATVTKLTAEDDVKVMVWKSLKNAIPRGVSQMIQ